MSIFWFSVLLVASIIDNKETVIYHLFTETARETVCFVDPRPSMFPEAKPRETSTVRGPQNTLLSRGLSK